MIHPPGYKIRINYYRVSKGWLCRNVKDWQITESISLANTPCQRIRALSTRTITLFSSSSSHCSSMRLAWKVWSAEAENKGPVPIDATRGLGEIIAWAPVPLEQKKSQHAGVQARATMTYRYGYHVQFSRRLEHSVLSVLWAKKGSGRADSIYTRARIEQDGVEN